MKLSGKDRMTRSRSQGLRASIVVALVLLTSACGPARAGSGSSALRALSSLGALPDIPFVHNHAKSGAVDRVGALLKWARRR
jgi:hypothetical protein